MYSLDRNLQIFKILILHIYTCTLLYDHTFHFIDCISLKLYTFKELKCCILIEGNNFELNQLKHLNSKWQIEFIQNIRIFIFDILKIIY